MRSMIPSFSAITCVAPATILHGSLNGVTLFLHDVEVTVVCDAGYEHSYDVRCLDTGHWNDTLDCTGRFKMVAMLF